MGASRPAEEADEDIADPGVRRPLVLGHPADDRLPDARPRVEGVVLGQDPGAQTPGARHPPVVGGTAPGEDAEQRRLAAPVAPDDPDAVTADHPEGDGVEHLRGAEGEGGALDGDQARH